MSLFIQYHITEDFKEDYAMKTFMASPATIERKWYVVDAEGQTLGRLAAEVAKVLRGKNKPIFTPHVDTGDYVIVVNASKIKVTGKKMDQKIYYKHSDYPGGMRETTLKEMLDKKPTDVITLAVKGMIEGDFYRKKVIPKKKKNQNHSNNNKKLQSVFFQKSHKCTFFLKFCKTNNVKSNIFFFSSSSLNLSATSCL